MKVVTVCIRKGGYGKTTFSRIFGELAVYAKKEDGSPAKVLLIDNDTQQNLTSNFFTAEEIGDVSHNANILKVYLGDSIENNVVLTGYDNLHIIPGSQQLPTADRVGIERLAVAIKEIKAKHGENVYDYVIIDNNPFGELPLRASILASDMVVSPFYGDFYLPSALNKTEQVLSEFKDKNIDWKIVPAMLKKTKTGYSLLNYARKVYQDKVAQTEIPFGQDVENAAATRSSIFLKKYGKDSVAKAYMSLFCELFNYNEVKLSNLIGKYKEEIKSLRGKKLLEEMLEQTIENTEAVGVA